MMLVFTEEAKKISQSEKCYHCGDDCKNKTIKSDEKSFCCEGCKAVYEILSENQLCTYYNIQQFPGKKVIAPRNNKYDFLDNEDVLKNIIEFKESNLVKATLYIPNIHCSSCLWLLENINHIHKGISRSQVNFSKKELTIFYDENKTSLRNIVEVLDTVGYPPQITLDNLSKKIKISNKHIYYKLGISGFCFGNIMLLSFPDYLGLEDIDSSFQMFFGYLSLLLSIPVFFYCASDYFISSYNGIKNKIINIDIPIALGLVVVFGRSAYEIISHTGGGYLDSFSGLVFFLLIGKWYQKKTFEAISFERDYKSYFPVAVTRIFENKEESVPLAQLKRGDLILIRNNELIPADGKIIEGTGKIDYSFVTGESESIIKNKGESIFAGGRQMGELLKIEIDKDVSQSYFTQLWNQDVFRKDEKLSLSNFANLVGKYFTIAVIILAVSTFTFWWNVNPENAVYAFVSVVIVFCPCTLALAIPFCYSNAMKILGRNKFYLKSTDTIEKFSRINTIIFDKTGTITSSEYKEITFHGNELNGIELSIVKSLTKNSSHPLSKTIFNSIESNETYSVENFEEVTGKGIKGEIRNLQVKLGTAEFVGIQTQEQDGTSVYFSINKTVKGYFKIPNKIREGIPQLINNISTKYDLHLLSGDQSTEKAEMINLLKSESKVHFGMNPVQKLEYIQKLQENNKSVLMIGDGLNDAGALKQSNVGISVSDNVYNFSPSCDAIISSDKLHKIDQYIAFCKGCITIAKVSLLISLTYNIIGLYFAMTAQLNPMIAAILMPASSVSVVLFVITLSNLLARRKKLL